ncbi:MAG: GAF domain-containing protein [Syntrophobacteraceae bacterium]
MNQKQDYFNVICKVSRALGTTLNRDELLRMIVESAIETMQVKAAGLFLFDEEESEFIPVAQKGLSENYVRSGLTATRKIVSLLRREDHIFSHDSTSDPRLDAHDVKKAEGIASLLVVPAMVKGKLTGGLCLFTDSPRHFSEGEIDLAKALAEQGAMAIENARLLGLIRQNTSLFLDLAVNINSSLDMKQILHILTADISEALKVKGSSILLLNEEKRTLEYVASYGLSETYLDRGPLSSEESVDETLTGQPVAITDVQADPRVRYKKEKEREGIVSLLSVPIKTKEKVIGVMRLYSGTRREFTEDEVMLVTALAYLGGLAIQNASLYLLLEEDMKDLKEDTWIYRSWF